MAGAVLTFAPRWKEELVCTMDGRQFVIEFSMGSPHVYLPGKGTWEQAAPDWARDQWERVHRDLSIWCRGQGAPLSVDDRAWVSFLGD